MKNYEEQWYWVKSILVGRHSLIHIRNNYVRLQKTKRSHSGT